MLSSISPLGERARHNRWGVTVAWYVAASTVAAAVIGAALGVVGGLAHLPLGARAAALAVVAVVAALADLSGRRIPGPRRQVDEDWLGRYRGAVYGAGFGAQLGAGVTTIVTSATVWLTLAAELLSGGPLAGSLIGAAFGLVRAMPMLAEWRTSTYRALQRRQRALAERAALARALAIVAALGASAAWAAQA